MRSRETARQSQLAVLESQIQQLQDQRAHLQRDAEHETQQWRDWLKKKSAYEKDMAWAIGYLLDKPIITLDEERP
jgi:hypothetical protein